MNIKHLAGGTYVGGAIFGVRQKWRPWQTRTWVFAYEGDRDELKVKALCTGSVSVELARRAVFQRMGR